MPCLGLGKDRRAPLPAVEAACPRRRRRRLPLEEEAARMGPQDGSGSGPPLVRGSTNRISCLRRWGTSSCSGSEKVGPRYGGWCGPTGDLTTRLETSASNPASRWSRARLSTFRGGSQLPGGCSGSSGPRPFPPPTPPPVLRMGEGLETNPARGHALLVRMLIRSPGFRWSVFPEITTWLGFLGPQTL